MKLSVWLLSLLQPAIYRILVSLGISIVTYSGFDVMFQTMQSQLTSGVGGLPSNILALFLLGGGGQGLSIIVGACLTRLTIMQLQKTTSFLMKAPS